MPIEIEKRFLVKGKEWQNLAGEAQHLRQGYLTSDVQGWTVRVRILGEEKAWLTLKSQAAGIARNEFEYLIPLTDGEALWKLSKNKLFKTRYELNLSDGLWVIDCFEKQNAPLVMAEVELTSITDKITRPDWCYLEVTSNKEFNNAALAQTPISNWPITKRLELNLA